MKRLGVALFVPPMATAALAEAPYDSLARWRDIKGVVTVQGMRRLLSWSLAMPVVSLERQMKGTHERHDS